MRLIETHTLADSLSAIKSHNILISILSCQDLPSPYVKHAETLVFMPVDKQVGSDWAGQCLDPFVCGFLFGNFKLWARFRHPQYTPCR